MNVSNVSRYDIINVINIRSNNRNMLFPGRSIMCPKLRHLVMELREFSDEALWAFAHGKDSYY